MRELPDVELMALAAADREDAFAILVERYKDVLLNLFLRKGVSYADGQDLAQRTFLRLWRYRRKYEPQAKFTTFLFLLAGQEAVDFFRAASRRAGLVEGLTRAAEVAADVKAAAGAVDGEAVRRAVAQLSPGLRDVVELGVFQDLPYADVGEALGIPVGTVKSRMFNALRKLKELLA
ncbi:MAG: RNA polymerase sigma factor [Kiritimatiellia bacterium]